MSKAPEHLTSISIRDEGSSTEEKYVASIKCTCGNQSLEISHSQCDVEESGIPQDAEIDGNFFFVIKAKCPECEKNHLVFDSDYHGWDGFVCHNEYDNRKHPRPPMQTWKCSECSSSLHQLKVEISMDPEVILQEGPVEDDDGGIILDEGNYENGFDWIAMSIKCCSCGHEQEGWVEYETM